MDDNVKEIINKKILKTSENLKKNNIDCIIANSTDEVYDIVKSLITKGCSIATGGSVSLSQAKVYDLITNGDYEFIDRNALSPEETLLKTYTADVYMCSSNAITERGELYNVDGNSNRISAIAYGPKMVIMVVGYNKIVRDIDEAVLRVKNLSAPANTIRLNLDTYCNKTGECISLKNNNSFCCDGCDSDSRICCNYLISAKQRHKNRIKIILVPEELGY